jgi:hypothetical protein
VTVRWSFSVAPRDCRPAWIEFTLKSSYRGSTYYAGGTDEPIRVSGRRGRFSFKTVYTPAGPPYVLLAAARTPDERLAGPTARIRVP